MVSTSKSVWEREVHRCRQIFHLVRICDSGDRVPLHNYNYVVRKHREFMSGTPAPSRPICGRDEGHFHYVNVLWGTLRKLDRIDKILGIHVDNPLSQDLLKEHRNWWHSSVLSKQEKSAVFSAAMDGHEKTAAKCDSQAPSHAGRWQGTKGWDHQEEVQWLVHADRHED